MATFQQLRETSRIQRKHAQNVRDDAQRARERSNALREIASRAKLSGDAKQAHAEAARRRHLRHISRCPGLSCMRPDGAISFNQLIAFCRTLRSVYGLPVRTEIHAAEFIKAACAPSVAPS